MFFRRSHHQGSYNLDTDNSTGLYTVSSVDQIYKEILDLPSIKTEESKKSPAPPETTVARQLLGILFAALSGLSIAMSAVCRKNLANLPPTQIVIHRHVGLILFSLPAMMYCRQFPSISMKNIAVLSFRGLILGACYLLAFEALTYLPLADFSVLAGCTPVFATMMARIFLKEECGIVHVFCLLLTVLGIVLVSKLPVVLLTRTASYEVSYYKGIALTLLYAGFLAAAGVCTRMSEVRSTHWTVVLFYTGVMSMIESLLASASYGFSMLSCGYENWIILLLSIVGLSIDVFTILAFVYQSTAITVMVITSANIIGSYAWQVAVEGIEPDVYTISGTVMTILCVFLLTLKQTVTCDTKWKIFSKN